jgi:hypothetical protein
MAQHIMTVEFDRAPDGTLRATSPNWPVSMMLTSETEDWDGFFRVLEILLKQYMPQTETADD